MKNLEELPADWGREGWRLQLREARQEKFPSRGEAAAASGLSMEVWKYVETGFRWKKGQPEPYGRPGRPTSPATLATMARAVGLDPFELVRSAGMRAAEVPVSLMEVAVPEHQAPVTVLVLGRLTDMTAAELDAVAEQVKEVLGKAARGYVA